jgi:two-component system, response regulator PdtaR
MGRDARRPIVLIVEDEAMVLLDAMDIVSRAGFEALVAANADEAIRVLEARADIAVVFTDVNMPGSMDGLKLAGAVRERWPPIRLIVTSGHFDKTNQTIPQDSVFLAKPYTPGQISTALTELTT